MKAEKELNKTAQCAKCPWKVDTNPYEIPNGYDPKKHRALSNTCQPYLTGLGKSELPVMACHETHDAYCVGWLHNQLGEGNNVALRIRMMSYKPFKLQVDGRQHRTFADTLPTRKHLIEFKKKNQDAKS